MKTFDEAFDIIYGYWEKADACTIENFKASRDYVSNPKFRALILLVADYIIENIAKLDVNTPTDIIKARICADLQICFQTGLLTGMEMEKSDGDTK